MEVSKVCLGMLLATAVGCRTTSESLVSSNTNHLNSPSQPTALVKIPDSPSLPIQCGNFGEATSFTLFAPDSMPTQIDVGLPSSAETHPASASSNNTIRIDGCVSSSDEFSPGRFVWTRTDTPYITATAILDSELGQDEDHSFMIGDLQFPVVHLPISRLQSSNLQQAIFGQESLLNMTLTIPIWNTVLGVHGGTSAQHQFVGFWIKEKRGENVSYHGPTIGHLAVGNLFEDPSTGCLADGWSKAQYQWKLGSATVLMDLCFKSSGSPFGGFTMNYYAINLAIDDDNAQVPLEKRHLTLNRTQGLAEVFKIRSSHHNFSDCAVIRLDHAVYILGLRNTYFDSCDVDGAPQPSPVSTRMYRYGIRYGQSTWYDGEMTFVGPGQWFL